MYTLASTFVRPPYGWGTTLDREGSETTDHVPSVEAGAVISQIEKFLELNTPSFIG